MSAQRGSREWVTLVGLVFVAATFSVLSAGILLVVPFALLAVALPPRRPAMVVAGIAMLALVMTAQAGDNGLWYFERGWTFLLGAWFVVFVIALPHSGFVNRALAALGATAFTAGAFLLATKDGLARIDFAVTDRLRLAAADAAAAFASLMKTPPAADDVSSPLANVFKMAEFQTLLFPACMGLASLAALGVGWWAYRRFGASDPQPLRPLREFRFSDHLIWVFVTGALLVLLPVNELANRTGVNLVSFMAALYALRGLAVLLVIGGAPGPLGMIFGVLMFVFLAPLVMAATMLVGLTDTWLDIRAKRTTAPPLGS